MGHTLGNDVEAGECTVYFEISQESHIGFYKKVIADEIEQVLVGIYLLKKVNK